MKMRLLVTTRSFFYSLFRVMHWMLVSLFVVGLGTCWAGSISGKITSDGVNGIAGVTAQAWQGGVWKNNAGKTTESGEYVISGLVDGSYTVLFHAFTTEFVSRWYSENDPNGVDELSATDVVISGGDQEDIDITLPPGESVSGQVSNDGGCESGTVEGLWVYVYDSDGEDLFLGFAVTLPGGAFTINGLPSSNWKIQLVDFDGSKVEEWYEDAVDFASATPVSAGTGDIAVNFCSLESGGSTTLHLIPVYMLLGLL